MMISNEMIIVYALSGVNIILLIIVLIKVYSKNKLNDVINSNTSAQNEKINNLLNYIKRLEDKLAQTVIEIQQTRESIQHIENNTANIEEETKRIEEAVRKEISITRIELNNQLLRSRQNI